MAELERAIQKRLIAYKVKILDMVNAGFAKDENSAGYIKLNGISVSRVNIIATLVYKSEGSNYSTAIIDDGTGRISLRTFENRGIFDKIDVGDAVLLIGKIREFNNEKYIIPEILKKLGSIEWLNIRKLESKNFQAGQIAEAGSVQQSSVFDEIYSVIKKLDNGDGVDIDEVIRNLNNAEASNIVGKLLLTGELFEIRPGRVKIL